MSNALLSLAAEGTDIMVELSTQPASAPATQPADQPLSQLIIIIITLGCAATIIWLIRTIINPTSLSLARTPGRPNRVNPLIHILLLLVAAFLVSSSAASFTAWLLGILDMMRISPEMFTDASRLQQELRLQVNIVAGIAMQLPLLIGSLLLARVLFDHGIERGLGLSCRHWFYDTLRGVAGLLIVYPACIGLLTLMALFMPLEKHIMLQALSLSFPWKTASVFSAVVLAPITEEIFFRGMIQSMFRQYLGRPWLAVVCTAALFGAAHYSLPATILPLALLGVAMGYVYERTGRLLAPIIMHILFNGISVFVTLNGGK
ncbi:MAG: CPBP family intramembrane metalloprotease [Planctomycetaceae bacterium]|nr:MAG: CPBP family intramembrane metalloprotease [Planctomycetaceae bacterium]